MGEAKRRGDLASRQVEAEIKEKERAAVRERQFMNRPRPTAKAMVASAIMMALASTSHKEKP